MTNKTGRGALRALTLTFLAAALLFAAACTQQEGCRDTFLAEGDMLPDATLVALDGSEKALGELIEGKVALVDLWATWCAPCIQAMPHLEELYKKHADKGFVVVGVMSDGNATKTGAEAVADLPISYPNLLDEDSEILACEWGSILGYPTVVLVDREGRVVHAATGFVDHAELDAKVEALLGEGTGTEDAPSEGGDVAQLH